MKFFEKIVEIDQKRSYFLLTFSLYGFLLFTIELLRLIGFELYFLNWLTLMLSSIFFSFLEYFYLRNNRVNKKSEN